MDNTITPISLDEESIKQLGKLLGVETVPSPTSVLAPLPSNVFEQQQDDEFQVKVNRLATYFINETERIMLIHLQHCSSMNIWYVRPVPFLQPLHLVYSSIKSCLHIFFRQLIFLIMR